MPTIENTNERTTMSTTTITPASRALFLELADDAGNWGGNPLVEVSPAERGNLTQLKRAGYLTTDVDDRGDTFANFTDAGITFADDNGVDLSWTR